MLAAALALAGCGGGGSSSSVNNAGTTPTTPTTPISSSQLYLSTDNTAINVSGDSVEVQARAIDANGGAIQGQAVQFTVNNPSLTGVVIDGTAVVATNESGVATVKLLLPVNTAQTKIDYLKSVGVTVTAKMIDSSNKVATSTLNLKGSAGGGSAINKVEKYNVAISVDQLNLTTGQSSTEIIVNVTDKKGGLIRNAPVILSVSTPTLTGASLSVPSEQISDDNGQVKFVVRQANSKNDFRLNHDIDLNVLVDDGVYLPETQTVTIPVTGTTLNLSSDSTIIGSSTNNVAITSTLRDGANQPIIGSKVELLNTDGSVLTNGTTNTQGIVVFNIPVTNLIANSAGQIRLSAKAYGNTSSITQLSDSVLTLITRDGEFVFVTLPTSETAINQSASITLQVKALTEAELTGKTLRLSSSLGTLDASVKPIVNIRKSGSVYVGDATFSLISGTPGVANLLATFGTDSIRAQTEFVSPVATKITLQASPAVVSPQGTSALVVRLTDANDAPVKNKLVQFTLLQDASSGQIVTPEAITNSFGEATVNYVAGSVNTAANGVRIRATADNLVKEATLTVAAKAINIAIGNANVISQSDNKTYYNMAVSADIRDNSGKPIANQTIALRILPSKYYKGAYKFGSIRVPPYDSVSGNGVSIIDYDSLWYFIKGGYTADDVDRLLDSNSQPIVIANETDDEGYLFRNDNYYTSPWECSPEDTNSNGFLDVDLGEDLNSNGKLDGMNTATLLGADGTGNLIVKTDSAGKIDFSIRYLKTYAEWLKIRIEASSLVQGSQPDTTVPILLPVLATDIDDTGKVIRPNMESPYGVNKCTEDK
jgi:hypothetical protein